MNEKFMKAEVHVPNSHVCTLSVNYYFYLQEQDLFHRRSYGEAREGTLLPPCTELLLRTIRVAVADPLRSILQQSGRMSVLG
jgi:hypothetical protein